MKNKFAWLLVLVVCLLSGCGKTAKCNDSIIKRAVVNIIDGQIRTAAWGREILDNGRMSKFAVTGIKTSEHNAELGMYMCEANIEFSFNGKDQSIRTKYRLAYMEDKNDTEVLVNGIDDIKAKLWMLVMFG